MRKKSMMLNDVPAPRSMRMMSASMVRRRFSRRTFCWCLMLAAVRRSAAPLMRRRRGKFVSTATSSMRSTRRITKSASERCGAGTPRQVCRFAPPRSASTSTTRFPSRASCHPRAAVSTDLPMPPLPPPTDQICRRGSARDDGRGARCSSEGHAGEDRVQEGPRVLRLLPQRRRRVADRAQRMPAAHHGDVALPPFLVAVDGAVVPDDEGGVERAAVIADRRRRCSRTRT